MSFTRFATSEPFDPASGERLNKLGDELQEQINDCFKMVGNGGHKSVLEWAKNNKNKILQYNGFNWTDVPEGKRGVWGDVWTISANSTTVYFKQNDQDTIYYRTINNNAWTGNWQQIATTTKTSFSCTATSGYTLSEQVCYTLNGEFYISLKVTKTDGSVFAQNERVVVATFPIPIKGVVVTSTMGGTSTNWQCSVNAYAFDVQLVVIPMSNDTKEIYVTLKGGVA